MDAAEYKHVVLGLIFLKYISDAFNTRYEVTSPDGSSEEFLPRVEVTRMLRVSLVTLNSWVKRGLPSHKQRGKVYFLHSEVLKYIKDKAYK